MDFVQLCEKLSQEAQLLFHISFSQRRRKILNAGCSRDAVLVLISSLTADVCMIIIDELLILEHQLHTLFQKECPIHL